MNKMLIRHHVMTAWAYSFISCYRENPFKIMFFCQSYENAALLHLTRYYLAKTKINKLNGNISPYKAMLKNERKGSRNGEKQPSGVFIHSSADIEALSGALGAETPLTRLVLLYRLKKMTLGNSFSRYTTSA